MMLGPTNIKNSYFLYGLIYFVVTAVRLSSERFFSLLNYTRMTFVPFSLLLCFTFVESGLVHLRVQSP